MPRGGVIFDVGDTLVNVAALRSNAFRATARDMRISTSEDMIGRVFSRFDAVAAVERFNNHLFGLPLASFEREIRVALGLDHKGALEFSSRYRAAVRSHIHPSEDVIRVLRVLRVRGLRVGILTNGTSVEMADTIRRAGVLPYVDAVVISEAIRHVKPESAAFHAAASQLGVDPESAVMVGNDFEADVLGALQCGWWAIWVSEVAADLPLPARGRAAVSLEAVPEIALELLKGAGT